MLTKNISTKICFVGDGGVGKTSLIARYIHDVFDDKYIKTIGTKVSRKEMLLSYPSKNLQFQINAMIWDIMGQKAFKGLLHDSYFVGAKGILGVCSLTDEETLKALNDWIDSVNEVVGKIPIVILANKSDLRGEIQLTDEELNELATDLKAPYLYTSAKTGENVDKAFLAIGREIIKQQFNMY